MSITVVGSIAYDAVSTPAGSRERMLGGAATHFALAASFFAQVRPVGVVGADFAPDDLAILATRGTPLDDIVRLESGTTFLWRGAYGPDVNERETLETRLGVFEGFDPALSAPARSCDVLFLANIQPAVQARVLDQVDGHPFTALDSMNLWIAHTREELVAVIERVDCLMLNDAELRQLTGRPTLIAAAREVLGWGPRAVVAKRGEYGAALVTESGFFALPAFALTDVVDPTGAGDTFAGAFLGHVARHGGAVPSEEVLRGAMACGTALASFNVESFGTEGVVTVTPDEIDGRIAALRELSRFDELAPARAGTRR